MLRLLVEPNSTSLQASHKEIIDVENPFYINFILTVMVLHLSLLTLEMKDMSTIMTRMEISLCPFN